MRVLFNLLGFLAMAVAIFTTTTSYSDEEDNRVNWTCDISPDGMTCRGRQDQIQQQLATISALVGIGLFVVANAGQQPPGAGSRPRDQGGAPPMPGPQRPGPMPGPGPGPGPAPGSGAPPAPSGWSQPRPPSP